MHTAEERAAALAELERAKTWLDEQRQAWMHTAEERAAALADVKEELQQVLKTVEMTERWAEQLLRVRAWLIEQRESHEATITHQAAQLAKHEATITHQAAQLAKHEATITHQAAQLAKHEATITYQEADSPNTRRLSRIRQPNSPNTRRLSRIRQPNSLKLSPHAVRAARYCLPSRIQEGIACWGGVELSCYRSGQDEAAWPALLTFSLPRNATPQTLMPIGVASRLALALHFRIRALLWGCAKLLKWAVG